MSWARLDDAFDQNDKILALVTDQRRYTWVRVLLFTAKRDDPHVPTTIREHVPRATPKFLRECLELGLLDLNATGYVVHDWDEYQAKKLADGELERRVNAELAKDPNASANSIAAKIGARRKDVLRAIRDARGGSQTVPAGGSGNGSDTGSRAAARGRPEPEPQPEPQEQGSSVSERSASASAVSHYEAARPDPDADLELDANGDVAETIAASLHPTGQGRQA